LFSWTCKNGEHMAEKEFHHGLVIKQYRQRKGYTQTYLGENWNNDASGIGYRYIQDVESGRKCITSQATLRRIATVLDIPLWKLGLSEYDPFTDSYTHIGEKSMIEYSLDIAETLLEQTWRVMRTEPLSMTENVLTTLISQVDYIATNTPTFTTESKRFLRLRGLVKNLSGALMIEKRQYPQALAAFQEMLSLAEDTNDTVNSSLALTRIGWELNRAGDGKGGIEALEAARELTFQTGKALASVVACYLARVYAENGEPARYERTMNTALEQAHHLGGTYLSTEDHNYWSQSFIAFGHVDSLIKLGRTSDVVAAAERYAELVAIESNQYQDVGVPRIQAHALVLNGELEEATQLLREYFVKCIRMQTAKSLGQSTEVIQAMKDAGYGQEKAVLELEDELREIVATDPHMKNALD
jgi:hypothetical protein